MSFSLPRGETIAPLDVYEPGSLHSAVEQVGTIGGALLGNLPDELLYSAEEDPLLWARRASGILAPVINEVYPGLIPSDYRLEGRDQRHCRGNHLVAHQDPTYRDTFFFGVTGEGSSADFRFGVHFEEPTFAFTASPGTMWILGGSALHSPERTGGKRGGTWHEVGAPQGTTDRHVAIGSFRRPLKNA